MCDSRTDTKTGLLPVNEVRSLLDVCWKAKTITELMPALPKGMKPRYVHVIDAVWHINEPNGQDTGTARVGDVSAFLGVTTPSITKLVGEMADLGLVVKHADLGGRGAGIDGQNSVRHKTYLLYACIVCSFFNESIITPAKTSVNGIFHHFATLFCRKSCLFFACIDRREAERHLRLPGGGVQLQDHGAVVAAHDLS